MGTLSTLKFLKNVAGYATEEAGLTTSDGAADADKIPVLNGDGVLDPSILNATNTSAGAADAEKIPKLDGSGRLSPTMMPTGMGQDSAVIIASETIASGDFVNIWDDSGESRVRKADASQKGKEAHGFVLEGGAADTEVTVFFEGTNGACVYSGAYGQVYLAATPGLATNTPPTGTGKVQQVIGFAYAANTINFQSRAPIVLA
jgi:hypothetical protein